MPSANGHAPRDVGMCGCLVGWLLAWLLGWLIGLLVEWLAPNHPKIHQDGLPNPSKIHQNGGQNPLGSVPRGLLESSWGILGPRWPQEASRAKMHKKPKHFHPPLGGQVGAKIHQKSILGRSTRWSFFVSLFGSTFEAIWCQLGSKMAPQTLPKWSQVGTKIAASWGVDLTVVLEGILAPFLLNFYFNMPRAK